MAAPSVTTKIWLALKHRLLEFTPGTAFAFPGVSFTPSGRYVRVGFTLIEPERILVDSKKPHLRNGTLNLTVCDLLQADGEPMLEMAGALAEHFPIDTPFTYQDVCVSVRSAPHVLGGFQDDGHWQVPVNITWQCFA